jgi:hypothetical protein
LTGTTGRQPTNKSSAESTTTKPNWLAGVWYFHDFGLTIDTSGHGTAVWRVGNCVDQPPPCDSTNGAEIFDGGTAEIVIEETGPITASGRILSTTKSSDLPVGPITARFDPTRDLLYLSAPLTKDGPLYGPKANPSVCGA